MAERFYQDFSSFWPFYVSQHLRPGTRALHLVGTAGGLAGLAGALTLWSLAWHWWLILAGLVFGYALAWIGHFFVERNRPATFVYPLWSFAGDFKMLWYTVTGRMGEEIEAVRRLLAEGWVSMPNRLAPPGRAPR